MDANVEPKIIHTHMYMKERIEAVECVHCTIPNSRKDRMILTSIMID